MRQAEDYEFDGREAFHAAVRRALEGCRHEIVLLDRDLQDWPFESAEGEHALAEALRNGARLRLLLGSTAWLERHGSRFLRTRRRFDGRVECRLVPPTLRLDDGLMLGDRQHMVRRLPGERIHGRCVLASPSRVEPFGPRLDAAWEECEPCLPSTVLGLAR
jgi:hypothetical protein